MTDIADNVLAVQALLEGLNNTVAGLPAAITAAVEQALAAAPQTQGTDLTGVNEKLDNILADLNPTTAATDAPVADDSDTKTAKSKKAAKADTATE